MKKRVLSMFLVLCLVLGMVPAIRIPAAAAEGGVLELPKGDGTGQGFIYYNFQETTEFTSGITYAFLDGVYSSDDAVAQLGSGAVLQATGERNNSTRYINRVYGSTDAAAFVKVETPGKGFDHCKYGGLYKMPDTSNPTEYRYFCWAGGAQDCGPLYAYTYDTATITWDQVTVCLNGVDNIQSNNSADYTVNLTYGDAKTVTLDPRSYTVQCNGRTATVTITDNAGNTIQGQVTLPCGVIYQPGGLNVTGMPANQGMLSGGSVTVAQGPTREGYAFQHWTDGTQTFAAGSTVSYKAEGNYALTAVWQDILAPQFECATVEVMTGTSGEMVQNSIKAALKITDNEPVSECTVTVDANDSTADFRGKKQIPVTVQDAAGNKTTQNVALNVLPGPLSFTEPTYSGGTLSVTLQEPGPDALIETGIVWSVVNYPTITVNNGKFTTADPVTTPGASLSTQVELAEGVTYYARAYAKVGDITYYGPQVTIGENVPAYGVFTITNNNSDTFTVSRRDGDDGAQTVYYRTVNGSAVGGTHFIHQSGALTFGAGEASKTITIQEYGVNATYDESNAATGFSNASRTYSVEIYRVDGGAVIENNRAAATRTMTGNTTVDRGEFAEKTANGITTEKERGDYDDDGKKGWTNGTLGASDQRDTISVQPEKNIQPYVQTVSSEIRYYVTFDAKEGEEGYQVIQIVPGSKTDVSIYPEKGNLYGNYSETTSVGYTAIFEHGQSGKDEEWAFYHFPAENSFTSGSTLTNKKWKGSETTGYIAFPVATDQVTTSFGACGSGGDTWYTKNVVHYYQFVDSQEPKLLAIGDMGGSTYRVGDSFTVSLIFNEIVDLQNSELTGKTIDTSWGTATYAGGGDTNVLYFTGTVPANADSTLSVTGIDSTAVIKDMAGNAAKSISGQVTANVNTNTPSFELSAGSISGGVGRATISNANEHTSSLRYAWSQSASMPATGWIPLTGTELEAAKTSDGFQAMTRQNAGSGVWYLHVLGVCDTNGALDYKQTSVNFGNTGGTIPGDTNPVPPLPTISVAVDDTNWARSRTITVTAANGLAEYRYGDGEWQRVSGNSVTVDKNGTYAFRCVSTSGEAVTTSATVEKIDTIAPSANIGAMVANTPTQKNSVYHSITLPVACSDTQSGVSTAEYVWSSSQTPPDSDWTSVGSATELTYTANESSETEIYLHLKVTDLVGNTVTVHSPAYQVISEVGAKAYAPTITIDLSANGGDGFTPWNGTDWTNETQTLVWKLHDVKDSNYVVTLPDGRITKEQSGTILVSQNDTYTVSVVDRTYGGSNSDSYTIDKIDTTAPTVTHTDVPTGWQKSAVTVNFTFEDQGGSGLNTAKYKIVQNNSNTPTDLNDFPANTGGSVTVSEDGEWYIYYEATDNTAGNYGDGTPRAANTTSGFVGPIQINKNHPTLGISGGDSGADKLILTVESNGDVQVAKDGGQAESVSGLYTVTEAGTYTFTATSNAGLTTQQTVQVCSVTFGNGISTQLVVSGGKVTEPDDPQKMGYTFDGWYNETTEWDFNAPVTQNLTLTAQWTLNTPAVTLTADKTEATYGEKVTLSADTTYVAGEDVTLTYAWYKNEITTPIANENGSTLTLSNVTDSGRYTVKITASGSGQAQTSTSSSVEINIAPRPVTLRWDYTGPIAYDGQEHTVTATVENKVGSDAVALEYTGNTATSAGAYITAMPRMARYLEVFSQIYGIYLKYLSPRDIHVYSIDESLMDLTPYLHLHDRFVRVLVTTMIWDMLRTVGITATGGIGTNLYLAKTAMDITVKHIPADKDGVRVAALDERSFRENFGAMSH